MGDPRLHVGGGDRYRARAASGVTHRSTPIAFIIVAFIFIGLTTFGWRLFVHGLRLGAQPRRARASGQLITRRRKFRIPVHRNSALNASSTG